MRTSRIKPASYLTRLDRLHALERAAARYLEAVAGLARIKDGLTLFELSPTKDQECYEAWRELNDAGVALKALLPLAEEETAPGSS